MKFGTSSPDTSSYKNNAEEKRERMSPDEIKRVFRNKKPGDRVEFEYCSDVKDASTGKVSERCRDMTGTINVICSFSPNDTKDEIIYCVNKEGRKVAGNSENMNVAVDTKDGGQPAEGNWDVFLDTIVSIR